MATIWFLKEGEHQSGDAAAERSLEWCVNNVGLKPDNWWAELAAAEDLVIGEKGRADLAPFRAFRYVVVEVNQHDIAGTSGWKTGFHLLDMNATEARKVLGITP